jgi:recombinational DNA repair protein RecR
MEHSGIHVRNRLTWYLFDHQHSMMLKMMAKLPRFKIPIGFCYNCGDFEIHTHFINFMRVYVCAECDTAYS